MQNLHRLPSIGIRFGDGAEFQPGYGHQTSFYGIYLFCKKQFALKLFSDILETLW
jgi:hypothetical protein